MVYLPFFKGGLVTAGGASAGLVWLAWAEFSAFQLSDFKERLGTSELLLCLAEKIVFVLGMAAGTLVSRALAVPGILASAETQAIGLVAGAGALMAGAAYATGYLVNERAEDGIRERLARSRREHVENAYDCIALEHGLTPREREVMGLLAEGYTRAYIREAFDVSDGTARAHIAHVYAKLGIHHKDDLLGYIDRRVMQE